MKDFEDTLRASIAGEVYFDHITRTVYSVDASIFEVLPLGVVIPKTKEDLQTIVRLSHRFHVPITVRGAATGIAGGCLGRGLVVDVSKWLNRLLTVDINNEYVVCEPGLIQDDLNRALSPYGYRLGPDTSTGNRATIGGMLGNNAAGARSLRYGSMAQHIQRVEMLLSNGEFITFGSISEEDWKKKSEQNTREGNIYSTLKAMQIEDRDEIARHFPSIPRRVSGYRLDELLTPSPFNASRLIAGSEGTLGIATEITLKIVPKLQSTALLLLFYDEMREALNEVPMLLTHHPLALEMIDFHILSAGHSSPQLRGKIDWLPTHSKAMLIVEVEGKNQEDAADKIEHIKQQLATKQNPEGSLTLLDQHQIQMIWELRKSGLGILLSKRSYSRAIAFIEDISVPPEHLAQFMDVFCKLLKSYGKEAGIYGHVGAGCMHIRPYVDLRDPSELSLIKKMMEEIAALVIEYGGALSGEHGDGWIRSWLNPRVFGERIMHAFVKMKQAFDPENLMNPGKIIPLTKEWEELRTQQDAKMQTIDTFLDFHPEGGFELAADLCNGNGLCRKKEGVMCPSFQVTGEEFHSTRARAQALRAIIHRRLPKEALTSKGMHDVMDLCLSCKGCKTECPSQVDMAKMKSEFLFHYQEENGYSFRNRLFSHIGAINSWSAPLAGMANRFLTSKLGKIGLNWAGITTERQLPILAKQRFSQWFNTYRQPTSLPLTVVLMNDTFTEYHHPEIGKAAVILLNRLGYHVRLNPWSCCGRPALSKGFLPYARKQAEKLVQRLHVHAKENLSIIGLEPSCLLTVRDDYRGLLLTENERHMQEVISHCWTLDEFLADLVSAGKFPSPLIDQPKEIYLHGHCYQKALVGMEKTLTVLNAVPGYQVRQIPSGCCGMAGSFGYEKEHEKLSLAIGEMILFPTIRSADNEAIIVASGTSCREQIKAGTSRKPLHLAQVLCDVFTRANFLVALCLLFFQFYCYSSHDYDYNPHVPIEVWMELKPHFFPVNHPTKKILDHLFHSERVTLSEETFTDAGFSITRRNRPINAVVTGHKALKGFLVKAYLDSQIAIPEWQLWLRRIKGVEVIRACLNKHGYTNFALPKKWIYPLPAEPSPPLCSAYNRKNFILIVEDMKILNHKENRRHYKQKMTQPLLRALYKIMLDCQLTDCVYIGNIPFTRDGKIAFVDTELFFNGIPDFNRLKKYLSPPMQQYLEELMQETISCDPLS